MRHTGEHDSGAALVPHYAAAQPRIEPHYLIHATTKKLHDIRLSFAPPGAAARTARAVAEGLVEGDASDGRDGQYKLGVLEIMER